MAGRDTSPAIREITSGAHRVRLDLSRQILSLSAEPQASYEQAWEGEEQAWEGEEQAWEGEERFWEGEERFCPTLQDLALEPGAFVPAGLLVQKAKQFDGSSTPPGAVSRSSGTWSSSSSPRAIPSRHQ